MWNHARTAHWRWLFALPLPSQFLPVTVRTAKREDEDQCEATHFNHTCHQQHLDVTSFLLDTPQRHTNWQFRTQNLVAPRGRDVQSGSTDIPALQSDNKHYRPNINLGEMIPWESRSLSGFFVEPFSVEVCYLLQFLQPGRHEPRRDQQVFVAAGGAGAARPARLLLPRDWRGAPRSFSRFAVKSSHRRLQLHAM